MKILFWDIETTSMVVKTWSLFKPSIPHENIIQHSMIICCCWKWSDDNKIHSVSILDDEKNFTRSKAELEKVKSINPDLTVFNWMDDRHVVEQIHSVLMEADMLVAHNGDRFDLRKFNARSLYHRLPPIPPSLQSVDTLKVARSRFYFDSNRLDSLGDQLNLGRKIANPKGLWDRAMNGDEKAIKQMVKYNKQDVKLVEDVYYAMRPYVKIHPNRTTFLNEDKIICPKCGAGSAEIVRRGFHTTATTRRQRYRCKACTGWSIGGTNILQDKSGKKFKVDLR
jgi:hypothetical protein